MHIKLFISLEGRVDGDVTNKEEKTEGGSVGLAAGDHEKDGAVSKTSVEGSSVGMDGSTAVGGGGGTGSRAPTPPAPTSVPVRTPFTAEDTVNLGSLVERKDDDLSLIVHVDDTLDNDTLDNDILGTPMRNATNDADIQMGAEPAEEETEDANGKAGAGVGGTAGEKTKDAAAAGVVDDGHNKENTATPAPSTTQTCGVTDTANDDKKKDADASKTDAKKDAGSDNKTKRLVCITTDAHALTHGFTVSADTLQTAGKI